jgi:hypothetical protein
MSVIKNISLFCETMDFNYIITLPFYAQLSFIITSQYKLKKQQDNTTFIAKEIINFFKTMPLNYMPSIRHKSNTCWIASSIWFASSMTLFLNMLKAYKPIGNENKLNNTLQFLRDKMRTTYNNPSDRKSAAGGNWDSILGCLVRKGTYSKGDDLDISRNWDDIIDVTPDRIRNQLFGYQKTKTSRYISDKSGNKLDKPDIIKIYEDSVNEYNDLYDNVIEEFIKILNKNNETIPNLKEIFGSKISTNDISKQPGILPTKIWEQAYGLLKGKKKGIINMDRFCGDAHGFKIKYNRSLCDMASVYKDIRNLQSNFSDKEVKGIIDYGVIIAMEEKIPSTQEYFTALSYSNPLVRDVFFRKFNISYTTKTEYFYKHKPYIVIKLGYNLDPYTGDVIFPENFKINRFITIENIIYELSSVAVKSGGSKGGHWWCLVKSNFKKDKFISYNDIDNENPLHVDLDYINNFTIEHYPSLVCYTKVPIQYTR